MRLGKSDKAVIKAFLDQRALDGHKLSTDGKRLDGHWMGGNKLASWKGDRIDLPDTGSRAGQSVQSAVRREAPKKWTAGNPDKPGPDNPIYVRGLGHVYIDSDDYLMLSDGRGSVGRIVSGTIKPSRDLGGAEASRLLAAFAEFGSPAKTTKRGGKKKNPNSMDSDAERMLAELVLIAVNDGDAYRDNKNAKRAVASAFRTYKEYQDDNRRETFNEIESHAIKEVRRRWRTENPTRGASSAKRNARKRNSHDVDKSTRYFKSALEAADRYLGTAVEQAEKGKLGESVQHLLYAAFWTGQARAEEQYADWQLIDPSQQHRLDEIEKGLKNWGRDTENWVKAR